MFYTNSHRIRLIYTVLTLSTIMQITAQRVFRWSVATFKSCLTWKRPNGMDFRRFCHFVISVTGSREAYFEAQQGQRGSWQNVDTWRHTQENRAGTDAVAIQVSVMLMSTPCLVSDSVRWLLQQRASAFRPHTASLSGHMLTSDSGPPGVQSFENPIWQAQNEIHSPRFQSKSVHSRDSDAQANIMMTEHV